MGLGIFGGRVVLFEIVNRNFEPSERNVRKFDLSLKVFLQPMDRRVDLTEGLKHGGVFREVLPGTCQDAEHDAPVGPGLFGDFVQVLHLLGGNRGGKIYL